MKCEVVGLGGARLEWGGNLVAGEKMSGSLFILPFMATMEYSYTKLWLS